MEISIGSRDCVTGKVRRCCRRWKGVKHDDDMHPIVEIGTEADADTLDADHGLGGAIPATIRCCMWRSTKAET